MKFDPLAQRQSMLPQKNLPVTPALEEEEEQRETKVDTPIGNADTPKKNPALAAIDRLLFYSPCPPATTDSEKVEAKQKKVMLAIDITQALMSNIIVLELKYLTYFIIGRSREKRATIGTYCK